MTRVLFVCLGNICRSPTAHAVFEHMVQQRGLSSQIMVDSAGTGDWHIGHSPDKRATATAKTRGIDMTHLRARQFTRDDFARFDYVLAMDNSNLKDMLALEPAGHTATVRLFLEFATRFTEREVPDPYYGGDEGFEYVFDLVEDASLGLIRHIQETSS
ncbi:low molecular weight protein-tyrosine-phosphatase [Litorivivens sp.]|uniref:low molecular weight protein-tyrosine-phosphatase n=1 Tax=Litorivivens sp. TaxID=2020868 RepID=UPI0035628336